MVKARGTSPNYPDSSYTLLVRALTYLPVAFDGGSVAVTNQPAGTWRYFRVDVPPGGLGWDIRVTQVTAGSPRLVVRRDTWADLLARDVDP